jgi:hypothetical protein
MIRHVQILISADEVQDVIQKDYSALMIHLDFWENRLLICRLRQMEFLAMCAYELWVPRAELVLYKFFGWEIIWDKSIFETPFDESSPELIFKWMHINDTLFVHIVWALLVSDFSNVRGSSSSACSLRMMQATMVKKRKT